MLVGCRKLVEACLIRAASDAKEERCKSVAGVRCRLLWIGPSGGGGLELQRGVGVVAAVNPRPHIHKSEGNRVLAFDLRKIDRTGPDRLRHDVVIQVYGRPKKGVALRLNLGERGSNPIDERRQPKRRGLISEALCGGLLDVAVHSEIK